MDIRTTLERFFLSHREKPWYQRLRRNCALRFIKRTGQTWIVRAWGVVRYLSLRAQGYRIVNGLGRNFEYSPARDCAVALMDILRRLGRTHFQRAIEFGCEDGTHYSQMLCSLCEWLIGVDILDRTLVENVSQYVKADPAQERGDMLSGIADASVECVFIINLNGMGLEQPRSDWIGQMAASGSRGGKYFSKENYLRVLRPGGYVIWIEWESYPERRFGRRLLAEVEREIDAYYPHKDPDGFRCVLKGFSPVHVGPYIVFQKA